MPILWIQVNLPRGVLAITWASIFTSSAIGAIGKFNLVAVCKYRLYHAPLSPFQSSDNGGVLTTTEWFDFKNPSMIRNWVQFWLNKIRGLFTYYFKLIPTANHIFLGKFCRVSKDAT